MLARLLEMLGIRRFYRAITSLTCEPMIPATRSQEAMTLTQAQIDELRGTTRYFLIAQLLRAAFYIPAIYAFAGREQIWLWLWSIGMMGIHMLFFTLDLYKSRLLVHWVDAEPAPPDTALSFEGPLSGLGWFYPREKESEEAYTKWGFEGFQNFVKWYVETTRLTAEQKRAGETIDYLGGKGRAALERFEHGTRVGELLHGILIVLNLPLLVMAIILREPLAIIPMATAIAIDSGLVLLQRMHRVRVWPKIIKQRKKDEAAEA